MIDYDVIVVGAGAMGLASTYYLSRVGLKVLCIDQFSPLHQWSASTGSSRLFRQAYFEDPRYIPLLKRALVLWQELELLSAQKLFHQNGFLVMSNEADATNHTIISHAKIFDIAMETLSRRQLAQRFTDFQVPLNYIGSFEPLAGVLLAEHALTTFMHLATKVGARIVGNEPLRELERTRNGVIVHTDRACYQAPFVVLALGPFSNILPSLPMRLTIMRAVQFWFATTSLLLHANKPNFAFASDTDFFYGFPALDSGGVKLARYHTSKVISDPLDTDVNYHHDELTPLQSIVVQYLPNVDPTYRSHKVCYYGMTKDENFLIDKDPEYPHIIYACGGSGHAFKFAPVIGEIVTKLILNKPSEFDITFLQSR